jgi:hypothetical protein
MPIVKLLVGRLYIDGSEDNFEGACAFHSINLYVIYLVRPITWFPDIQLPSLVSHELNTVIVFLNKCGN